MRTDNIEAGEGADEIEPEPHADLDYWEALIDENELADFLDLKPGTLQNYRQAGTGPKFIRISSRCVKYTRRLGKNWCDERLVTSTSDPGHAG